MPSSIRRGNVWNAGMMINVDTVSLDRMGGFVLTFPPTTIRQLMLHVHF
jgi:hypothetical protein